MIITVPVTPQHISSGEPGRYGRHPVEFAISDAVPGAREVSVGTVFAEVAVGTGDPQVVVLPRSARDFINRFDCRQGVEPFTFEIELEAMA